MEAELEMCFVRKVKTYCETRTAQKDGPAAAVLSTAANPPAPEKSNNSISLTDAYN